MKFYWVTQSRRLNKKTVESTVVGFVSTFGWEKPGDKVQKKYPHLGNFQVHEMRRHK